MINIEKYIAQFVVKGRKTESEQTSTFQDEIFANISNRISESSKPIFSFFDQDNRQQARNNVSTTNTLERIGTPLNVDNPTAIQQPPTSPPSSENEAEPGIIETSPPSSENEAEPGIIETSPPPSENEDNSDGVNGFQNYSREIDDVKRFHFQVFSEEYEDSDEANDAQSSDEETYNTSNGVNTSSLSDTEDYEDTVEAMRTMMLAQD